MYYSQNLEGVDSTADNMGQHVSFTKRYRRGCTNSYQMMGQGHDTSMVDMLDEATLRQYGQGIEVAMDPNDDDDDEGMLAGGSGRKPCGYG